jgi:hypothetical protein
VPLGAAHKQTGAFPRAAELLERALDVESDRFARARIFVLLADVHRAVWRTDAARDAVWRGLAEMRARLPRNPVALVLSTVLMFVAAVLMRWTGIGFGTARGEQRRRCEMIASLHEAGSYVGVLSLRQDHLLMHNLRVIYWIGRLGSGEQYARCLGTFAFMCEILGLRRMSARNFARAEADPSMSDPVVRAVIAHYRAAARCMAYHDNGEAWRRAVEEHGRWMEVAAYSDALAVLFVDAFSLGRTAEAAHWCELGRRRLSLNASNSTSLAVALPSLRSMTGRHAEAAAELRRVTTESVTDPGFGMKVQLLVAEISLLVEQNETGPALDRLLDQFAAYKLRQPLMLRPHRNGNGSPAPICWCSRAGRPRRSGSWSATARATGRTHRCSPTRRPAPGRGR